MCGKVRVRLRERWEFTHGFVRQSLTYDCASIWKGIGGRAFSTTGYPAMIRYRSASPNWHRIRLGTTARCGPTGLYGQSLKKANRLKKLSDATSCKRLTAGFQYVGPGMDREWAEELAKGRCHAHASVGMAPAPDYSR